MCDEMPLKVVKERPGIHRVKWSETKKRDYKTDARDAGKVVADKLWKMAGVHKEEEVDETL